MDGDTEIGVSKDSSIEDLFAAINDLKIKNAQLYGALEHMRNENSMLKNMLGGSKHGARKIPRKIVESGESTQMEVHSDSSQHGAVCNTDCIENAINSSNISDNNDSPISQNMNNANQVNGNAIHNNYITNNNDSPISQNDNNRINNNVMRNKKKIFQVVDTNIGSVLRTIKSKKCVGFTLKQSNVKSAVKITIDKPDEIPVIRDALKENSINFHEFKWENEKQIAFIIRGLAGITGDDIPIVFEELMKAGIPSTAKLSIFKSGFMKANPENVHNQLLKLVLPPNFDMQIIKKIRYIDHVAVTFERMKSRSVVQCSNCQRFGHSAAGCHHVHRCVKCGANHLRDKCPRTFDKSIKLVCCNCGGDHSANNLSHCSYFINNFGSKKTETNVTSKPAIKINQLSAVKRSPLSNKISEASYADVANMFNSNSNNNRPAGYADLSKKMDRILQLVLKHDAVLQRLATNV